MAALCGMVFLGGCTPVAEVNRFAPGEYPKRLSDWGVLQRQGNALTLGRDVLPYDVNTPLFADYALKLRTIWLPPGESAEYAPDDAYAMPVGTLISKTFFYPMADGVAQVQEGWNGSLASLDLAQVKLLETRLLIRQADGWDAVAYVWRGDDAWLNVTGVVIPMPIAQADGPQRANYIVPSRNQCAACHAAGAKPKDCFSCPALPSVNRQTTTRVRPRTGSPPRRCRPLRLSPITRTISRVAPLAGTV